MQSRRLQGGPRGGNDRNVETYLSAVGGRNDERPFEPDESAVGQFRIIRRRAIRAGLKLVDCPIRHLGTEKAQELYLAVAVPRLPAGVTRSPAAPAESSMRSISPSTDCGST